MQDMVYYSFDCCATRFKGSCNFSRGVPLFLRAVAFGLETNLHDQIISANLWKPESFLASQLYSSPVIVAESV